jgi:hypothetical protein
LTIHLKRLYYDHQNEGQNNVGIHQVDHSKYHLQLLTGGCNMTAQVLKIGKPDVRPINKPKRNHFAKAMRRQKLASTAVGIVAVTLTGLSLCHLAQGIEIVTSAATWESWAMAVGIDLGFVSLEAATLMAATDKLRKHISQYTKPAIIGTLVGSALMNAFAFASQTTGWKLAPAILLGLAIPALIYAMTRIGAALYIDCHSKN